MRKWLNTFAYDPPSRPRTSAHSRYRPDEDHWCKRDSPSRMCSERPPDRCLLLISSQTKGRGKYRKICPTEVFREPRKLELATTGAEPGLHHGDLLLIGNHLWISGKS